MTKRNCSVGVCSSPEHCAEIAGCFSDPTAAVMRKALFFAKQVLGSGGLIMTTPQTAHALALIAAAQARIAGMQAANLDRQMQGYSLAYSEEAFFQEAGSLEQIAEEVINQ